MDSIREAFDNIFKSHDVPNDATILADKADIIFIDVEVEEGSLTNVTYTVQDFVVGDLNLTVYKAIEKYQLFNHIFTIEDIEEEYEDGQKAIVIFIHVDI